jgi:hypothetical protein
LRLVLIGTFGVPVFAATTSGFDLFATGSDEGSALLQAPPHFMMAVLGLAMVSWAVGRRYLKSVNG